MSLVEPEADNPEALEWTVWPAGRRPLISVAIAVFAMVLAYIAIWSFGRAWYGFITLLVLALALAKHYFPTSYRMDERGILVKNLGAYARAWSDFQMAHDLGISIILSSRLDRTSAAARRGMLLLFAYENHDDVIAFLRKHMQVVDKRTEKGRQR